MILVFLLVLPQFIRNVIISGYFVYPMQFLGIKFLDWKIPDSVMLADQKMIKVWARMRILGDDGLKNFDQGFKSWIPVWWLNNFNDLILLLFLFSIIIFIAALIAFNKQIKPYIRLILPIYVAQLAYLSFWFFTAPLIRFGYGILTSSSILLILPFVYIVIFDKKMSQLNLALQFI
jgi:hypothetical protein